MRPTLLEGHCTDSNRVEIRIEVSISKTLPFVLECDTDHRGNRLYMELPRSYSTLAGAKIAAANFVGDRLIWLEPAHKREL